jgi:Cytochrome c554 and c-prime
MRRSGSFVMALAGVALVGCRAETPKRPIALVVSGDTAGWIVPCGCTTNQSGGLPRRATCVHELAREHDLLVLDAGGAPGGTSPYQRVKFEAILAGEAKMGVASHNIGAAEAAFGAEELRKLAAPTKTPFLSTNLRDADGKPIAEGIRVVTLQGQRFAIVGVLSPKLTPTSLRAEDPREAILKATGALSSKGAQLIVLAYVPEDELRALARSLPEADFVIGGPTGQSVPPEKNGPTWLASATNKGKFLATFVMNPGDPRPTWKGEVVELTPRFADDAEQLAVVQDYLQELGRRDFTAAETGLAPELPAALPKGYRIAGTERCIECHRADGATWSKTGHAHAWQTLLPKGSQVDAACQQCHTTGFGLPGGFTSVSRSPTTTAVGCESCHGPSHDHAADPTKRTPFVPRDQCARCHDRENSPTFAFAAYWPKIRHGEPAEKGGRP